MRMIRILLFVLLGGFGLPLIAQPALPGKTVNGCGPQKWKMGILIPDKIGSCKLENACNQHDLCYSRCRKGGDLYGTDACDAPYDVKQERRRQCDAAFYEAIVADNDGQCTTVAGVYQFFVKKGGNCCFNGMKISVVDEIVLRSQTPADAMRQLEYLEALERGGAPLALAKVRKDGSVQVPIAAGGKLIVVPAGHKIDAATLMKVQASSGVVE